MRRGLIALLLVSSCAAPRVDPVTLPSCTPAPESIAGWPADRCATHEDAACCWYRVAHCEIAICRMSCREDWQPVGDAECRDLTPGEVEVRVEVERDDGES